MSDTFKGDTTENAPPFLLQPNGRRWLEAFGQVKDSLADRLKQAVKARFPLICPADALPSIGEERGLPRGIMEPEAQYRARLVGAWDVWTWAGTPMGLLRAMQLAGYPAVALQCQSGKQYTLNASTGTAADLVIGSMPAPVHLGGSPELWSDVSVLILQPWPSWWGGSSPADGSPDQKTVANLILRWKNAWNRCVALKVVSGATWDGGFFWDTSGKTYDSGTSVTWTAP